MKLKEVLFVILFPVLFLVGIALYFLGVIALSFLIFIVSILVFLAILVLTPYYLITKKSKTEGKNYDEIEIKSF